MKKLVGKGHSYRADIASILTTRIINYALTYSEKNPITKPWFDDMKAGKKAYIEDGIDLHPCHPDAVSAEVLKLVWDDVNDW